MMRPQGSIFSVKNKSGHTVYKVEVSVGKRADGTRRRIRRTAKTLVEAQEIRIQLLSQKQLGELSEGRNERLDSFALWWLRTVKAQEVRPATAGDYEDRYRRVISPFLGNKRLGDIQPRDVAEWMKALSSTYSVATINGARRVLSMILQAAVAFDHLQRNPISAVRPHKALVPLDSDRGAWSKSEAMEALSAAKGNAVELPLTLALMLGLRRSEILGLRWDDFDFEKGTLTISRVRRDERTLNQDGTASIKTVTYPPKSASSRRRIPLSSTVMAALIGHRERQQSKGFFRQDHWVFATHTGNPIGPSRLSKVFRDFLKEKGFRRIRFHDLRHSTAHLSLEAGVRIETLSQILGHSRIDTTKSIYAPFVEAINSEFTERLDDFIGGTAIPHLASQEVDFDVE